MKALRYNELQTKEMIVPPRDYKGDKPLGLSEVPIRYSSRIEDSMARTIVGRLPLELLVTDEADASIRVSTQEREGQTPEIWITPENCKVRVARFGVGYADRHENAQVQDMTSNRLWFWYRQFNETYDFVLQLS